MPTASPGVGIYRIDHVADGDTVELAVGDRVRLVQIDTPEVYFGTECYGPQASAITRRLLPPGTAARLTAEPATDRIDRYGRLLRCVFRARDNLNVRSTSSVSARQPRTSTTTAEDGMPPCLSGSHSAPRRLHLGLLFRPAPTGE